MSELLKRQSLPDGFATRGDSDLLVPAELAKVPLVREVITQAEWKRVSATIQHVCRPHNIRFVWQCNDPRCFTDEIKAETKRELLEHLGFMQQQRTASGFVLKCRHREIVYDPGL